MYTAQIRHSRKRAFSRQFWRGRFSVYLDKYPVTCPVNIAQLAYCSKQLDRWLGNSGRRSTSLFMEREADADWRT